MTFRPSTLIVSLAMLLPASAMAADEDSAPQKGDLANGIKRYRLDCAACHGVTAGGDGPLAQGLNPHPARLRDGAYLWAHGDEQILDAILGEGLPAGSPPHGQHLTRLDARDILAWLREPVLEISSVYPLATDYIAHMQEIDQDGQDRAAQVLGRPLTPAETKVMIFTVYRADPASGVHADGHPKKVADDPASLYAMQPRRRGGFVLYDTLDLAQGPVDIVMLMSNDARLTDIHTMASQDPKVEKGREKLEEVLRSYIGSGGRVDKQKIEPHERGVKATKDVQKAMELAFERLLEGDAMFLKEEQKRFELDPDAFNFPQAEDQPTNVKFDFKQKKTK